MINLTGLKNIIKPDKVIQNKTFNVYIPAMYAQKSDSFERSNQETRVTNPINFTGKSNRIKEYQKITETLKKTADNAQTALNGQLASDGWAGKVADAVSVLWNSKNRAALVQTDIDQYKKQVKALDSSIKEDNFKEKYKEMFDVEYKHSNIFNYGKKAQQLETAVTADCTAKLIENKLSDSMNTYKKLSGNLKDVSEQKISYMAPTGSCPVYTQITTKDEIFENMEKSLIDVFGSKDVLNSVLKAGNIDTEKTSKEDKYKAYGFVADFLINTSKETAKECTKGQSLEQIKTDYDAAYEKAYGTKNNIQERVDKYCRSQEIGAAAVRGVTRSALAIAATLVNPPTGITKIALNSAMTFGIKVAVDGSDKLTNDVNTSVDFNSKAIKKLVKSAAISAAEKFATGCAHSFIPDFDTGNEVADTILNQGKDIAADTYLGLASEKLKHGKWAKNQIVPRIVISAVFKNLTPDSDVINDLLSMTKGGVNQIMKKSTRTYEYVKTFVQGTRQVLEENYKKDKELFADLKKLSDENPEEYENLIAEMLKNEIKESMEEKEKIK